MLNENHIVEKSQALVWSHMQNYSAGELKLLDTYLSRINARDPDSARVVFTKSEYTKLMGLESDARTEHLKACTDGLMKNVVTIEIPGVGWRKRTIFPTADCMLDKESGQVLITIECHPELRPVFFDLSQNGYIKYQLKNTLNLKSAYSIKLYSMLKAKHFKWTVGVEQLKEALGATNKSYQEFKAFNRSVLQKAVNEINEMTDLRVAIEQVRTGRTVTTIVFTYYSIAPKALTEPEEGDTVPPEHDEPYLFDYQSDEDIFAEEETSGDAMYNEAFELAKDSLPDYFTPEQVELLRTMASEDAPYPVMSFAEKSLWVCDYLSKLVKLMRAQKKKVNDEVGWLTAAIRDDYLKIR